MGRVKVGVGAQAGVRVQEWDRAQEGVMVQAGVRVQAWGYGSGRGQGLCAG